MAEAMLDPTARFEKALVQLIRSFNYLDTNVGLCISFLMQPSNPATAYPAIAKMTAERRIERLKQLLEARDVELSEKLRNELTAWYENAAKVRSMRNRYVHGNWEFLPQRHQEPVGVSAPPWMNEQLGSLANETMSLEHLEAVADEVKGVFNELMRLRRRLGV